MAVFWHLYEHGFTKCNLLSFTEFLNSIHLNKYACMCNDLGPCYDGEQLPYFKQYFMPRPSKELPIETTLAALCSTANQRLINLN